MTELGFVISRWAAWAPGLENFDSWLQWAAGKRLFGPADSSPPVDFIPALQRRRLSLLSKISLSIIQKCSRINDTENQLADRIIFCSRYGEIHRTTNLTWQIVNAEELSPTGFSLSVHNTAVGLNSIITNNKSVFTSIAGGKESFFYGLIEAATFLKNNPSLNIMVVMADESMPEVYQEFADEVQVPYGIAFMLRAHQADTRRSEHEVPDSNCQQVNNSGNISDPGVNNDILTEFSKWQCQMGFTANRSNKTNQALVEPQGLTLLRCLLNNSLSLCWDGPILSWSFTISHG